jgi:hypothetical protein
MGVAMTDDILCRETRRLVLAGVVQESRLVSTIIVSTQRPLRPRPRPGRKRVYQSNAKRQRAYRYRSKSRTVTK